MLIAPVDAHAVVAGVNTSAGPVGTSPGPPGGAATTVIRALAVLLTDATSVLGMGASGTRLGAELALIRWLGRDRTAVAAALGETTVLGGRALGAPAAGSFGDAYGGAYAFGAIGLAALLASGLVMVLAAASLRRTRLLVAPVIEPVPLRLSE